MRDKTKVAFRGAIVSYFGLLAVLSLATIKWGISLWIGWCFLDLGFWGVNFDYMSNNRLSLRLQTLDDLLPLHSYLNLPRMRWSPLGIYIPLWCIWLASLLAYAILRWACSRPTRMQKIAKGFPVEAIETPV